jgi:hypothetical protein
MMKPAYHDNILACYPALLARLEGVPGVKKVYEVQEMGAIGNDRAVMPIDGAVYVILDGFTPTTTASAREQTIDIGFSVILAKRNYNPNRNPYRVDGLGETYTAIARAMQGYDPVDADGRALTTRPFTQRPALPIDYRDGYALFPLRFTAAVALIADTP